MSMRMTRSPGSIAAQTNHSTASMSCAGTSKIINYPPDINYGGEDMFVEQGKLRSESVVTDIFLCLSCA
jgi:hypothetical protein